jgi:hypothetical protein
MDWVRKMQRWEVVLAGMNPDAIVEDWEALRDDFRVAEAQLARAIIAVGLLGDANALDRLADHAPASVWTKAALAQVGVPESPRERAQALLDVVPLVFKNYSYEMIVTLEGLDDRVGRHELFSDSYYAVLNDCCSPRKPSHTSRRRQGNGTGTASRTCSARSRHRPATRAHEPD